MALYTITHRCGHQTEMQLYGPHKYREGKIRWLEQRDCQACRKAAEDAAVSAAKAERGLCDLNGSERMVAWADAIREKAYRTLDIITPLARTEQAREMVARWRGEMESKKEAKWWIDHRFGLPDGKDAREGVAMFNHIFKVA